MEQGPTERVIIQQCIANNMPLPEKIKNAPALLQGLELYYMAFMDLTTCRGQGYGSEGPIGWLQMFDYCCVYDISGEQQEDLFYHVQHLDRAYLEYKSKKLKEALQNKPGKK